MATFLKKTNVKTKLVGFFRGDIYRLAMWEVAPRKSGPRPEVQDHTSPSRNTPGAHLPNSGGTPGPHTLISRGGADRLRHPAHSIWGRPQ